MKHGLDHVSLQETWNTQETTWTKNTMPSSPNEKWGGQDKSWNAQVARSLGRNGSKRMQ